jgi:uncharacterized repeat protein (TIGR01451 family)/LPXTG-motif cell wall-anchored protein
VRSHALRRRVRASAVTLVLVGPLLAVWSSPATAAVSSTEQWITSVTGGIGADATVAFGTSGVSATLEGRPGGCSAAQAVNNATLTSFGTQAYWSPQAPTTAQGINNCVTPGVSPVARDVVFNKPIVAPVLHVNNLDASTLAVQGADGAGAVTLSEMDANASSQVVGGNQIVPANIAGFAGCNDTPPGDGVNNSTCGSYRLSQDGGPVTAFSLTNTTQAGAGNDGWYWSLSFPTASLTKAFSEKTVRVGKTVKLTFTIDNPQNEGAVDLDGMSFTDTLPTGLTLANGAMSDNGSCGDPSLNGGDAAAGDTSVTAAEVDVAAGDTCTITVNVTGDESGSYTNDTSNLTTSIGNLVPEADTTLRVIDPELTITKTGTLDDTNGNGLADEGETIDYGFLVENTGDVDLTDVAVRDDKVTGLAPASADLAAGDDQEFTADPYTVTAEDVENGSVDNTASAVGTLPDDSTVESATDSVSIETGTPPGDGDGGTNPDDGGAGGDGNGVLPDTGTSVTVAGLAAAVAAMLGGLVLVRRRRSAGQHLLAD